jgi:tight adherence protein B
MWLLNLLVFLTAFFTVFAASAALSDLGARERRRLRHELQEQLRQRERERMRFQDFSPVPRGEGSPKPSRRQSLESLVEQSGVNVPVGRLLLISLGLACCAGLFCGLPTASLLLTVTAAGAAATLPLLYVLHARHRRMEKLLSQFPDALELMSRVLRSGQTIAQAIKLVADEFSAPLSLEFFRCHEQMSLGLSPDDALHELARRIGLLEGKIFAVAVLVQRQTGGNLSELFDNMSALVRERFRIRGLIRSLTAQGRMQAIILLSLPVAMFVLLMVLQPKYEIVLLQYPALIVTALALMGIGGVWINRIVHFDF